MPERKPKVNVDILVVRDNKLLLGLLTDKWNYKGNPVWGVPGRDLRFREKIWEVVNRNIKEEFGCNVTKQEVICVNANYALGNHYIGIGVVAEIDGMPSLLIPADWKEWRWFAKDEIPSNLFPATENLIKCFLSRQFSVSG